MDIVIYTKANQAIMFLLLKQITEEGVPQPQKKEHNAKEMLLTEQNTVGNTNKLKMKKLLIILLCLPIIGFGQLSKDKIWIFNSGFNDFDGNYKTASVLGKGTDYPYNTPSLVINYIENINQINFYIADAGYFLSSSNTRVQFSFSNEKGRIYEANSISHSGDNTIVFLGNNFSLNNNRIDIFNKLMSASYVNIRVSDEYGKNDLNFTLNGSSNAIKQVIPKEFFEEHNSLAQKKIEEEKEKEKIENRKVSIRDSILMISLNNYNVSKKIKNQILNEVNNKISDKGYEIDNIDSLLLWKSNKENKYFINVKIYYNSYYAQEFMEIIKISKNIFDNLLSKEKVFNSKDDKGFDNVETRPKRKDYKSSNDYFKALREYNKKKNK